MHFVLFCPNFAAGQTRDFARQLLLFVCSSLNKVLILCCSLNEVTSRAKCYFILFAANWRRLVGGASSASSHARHGIESLRVRRRPRDCVPKVNTALSACILSTSGHSFFGPSCLKEGLPCAGRSSSVTSGRLVRRCCIHSQRPVDNHHRCRSPQLLTQAPSPAAETSFAVRITGELGRS